jgi:hypothetical protein
MAFRLELSASFDYHDNPLPTSLDFWREHRLVDRFISVQRNRSRGESVQLNLTPPSRRFSCGFGEDPCKMALVGESALERYFSE